MVGRSLWSPLRGRPLRGYGLSERRQRGGGVVAFNPLSLSPVAWWRLNDGSGITAVDSSGNGYDLTLSNTPTWIAGHIGGGLNFVAGDGEIGTATSAGLLAALAGLSAFTITFWSRAAAYQTNAANFSIRNGAGTADLFNIYSFNDSGGNGVLVFWNDDFRINQNAGAAPVDQWNFYAFVSRSATDHEMLVNNASVGTNSTNLSLSATPTHVNVGAYPGAFFSGDMDEVMIFDSGLTAAELTALYGWAG